MLVLFLLAEPDILTAQAKAGSPMGASAMTHGMTVQLPVSVAFGTDAEFDLRVQLESDLTRVLADAHAGECIGGGIDTTHLNLHFDGITDPAVALSLMKQVLAAAGRLNQAVILFETPSLSDPDDRDQQILWPANQAGKIRVV